MNIKTLGFAGAGLLIVGLFLPIASIPFLGSITLMSTGFSLVAIGLLILGLLSGLLVWADRRDALIWTGGAALLTVIYLFGRLEWAMMQMRSSLNELHGNPFSGLAQTAMATTGLQWGWLILASGPALIVYVAVQQTKEEGAKLFSLDDRLVKIAAGIAAVALLVAPAQDAWSYFRTASSDGVATGTVPSAATTSATPETNAVPSPEAVNYINKSLRLYEFKAKYYDSLMDGRVPGVDFKIKNEGDKTIKSLTVKVVFFDATNKPVGEELFYPVNVTEYGFGNENKPLRPNYIWQQEGDHFYTAKTVPSEWKEGNAKAMITEVEFAPTN